MSAADVRIVVQTPEYVAVQSGPVVANLFLGAITVPIFQRLVTTHKGVFNQYQGVYHLDLLESRHMVMDKAVQHAGQEFNKECGPQIRGLSLVYEQAGFKAAVIRGVVVAVMTVTRQNYEFRSFNLLREGSDWLINLAKSHGKQTSDATTFHDTLQKVIADSAR